SSGLKILVSAVRFCPWPPTARTAGRSHPGIARVLFC
ncbi:uncharacterized protein METZ01_LOCUS52435, partial [marine metagenome]